MNIIEKFANSFIFWSAWVVIPFFMEIVPTIGSFFVLLKKLFFSKKIVKPILYPDISIIIPVYNSEATLEDCIRSINDSTYPNERIRVFLVNNQGSDNSFAVYTKCQQLFPTLRMQWLNAQQGKSRALNLALYNSEGKYIVHVDSDGLLEKSALTHLVDKFENNTDINCMTGAIMVRPDKIEEYPRGFQRLMRKLEFLEYAQAFLAGRNYSAEFNNVYTLSGAFSAFRKSAILKSRLYNTDTICEDTQITFQMKYIQNEKVDVADKSIFFVDPIDNMNKLYTQRQRWQRGSLEVSNMFVGKKMKSRELFSDVNVRTLMYDHTFALPRFIWYVVLIFLAFIGYSRSMIITSTVLLFILYTFCGYLYYFTTIGFLKEFPEIRKYYAKQFFVVFLMPVFNLIVFFFRLAGIINSINTNSAWRTRNFSEEFEDFKKIVADDTKGIRKVLHSIKEAVNADPAVIYAPKSFEERLKGSFPKYLIFIIISIFSVVLGVLCHWSKSSFSVGLNEIINTLLGPLEGTGSDTVVMGVRACLPPILIALFIMAGYIIVDRIITKSTLKEDDKTKKAKNGRIILAFRKIAAVFCVFMLVSSLVYANYCYNVVGYAVSKLVNSSFYEQYYVEPKDVAITADGKTKNLIYIYMESMETTYASVGTQKNGGMNYIPELTKLANENVSFSNADGFGGFLSNYGATWTMGALFTTSTAVPYALPVNDVTSVEYFASGITAIGDILAEKGYNQEFMCGSDAVFGGRKMFFEQHGNYEIFDYYTAVKRGYISSDYKVWWGFEDEKLYDMAKDEALRLAAEDKPFNLTLLTVDTHFPDGYICNSCRSDYPVVAANVVTCADRQIAEFISWCKEQDFYEDTLIVITGDHPRMDSALVEGVDWYDRSIYNCFINATYSGDIYTKNRLCAAIDIMPTVLSGMGFSIEGDRLGLGTNLFSAQRTITEILGIPDLEEQLQMNSKFYVSHFAPELLGTDE